MTEEEAKTKWCPQTRFTGTPSDDLVPNRSEPLEDATRCIASACMAWRKEIAQRRFDGVGVMVPNQDSWGEGYHVRDVVVGGYCGLAGAVQ